MRLMRAALGAAAAVALPPAEAVAMAQAVEAMAARGLPRARVGAHAGARLGGEVARGLLRGAAILGSCLPR